MSDFFDATSFNHALKTLGLSPDEFLRRAQTAGVLLYFPLPEGAKLQPQNEAVYAEATTVSDIFNRTTYSTTVPLAGMEYFAPDSQLLMKAIQYPGVLFDHVTRLAKRPLGENSLITYSLNAAMRGKAGISHHDTFVTAVYPMKLKVPAEARNSIHIEQALVTSEALEKIANHIDFPIPPGVHDFGSFEPSEYSSRLILDLNTVFYQFVAKQPSTKNVSRLENEAKHWLQSTWENIGKRKKNQSVSSRIIDEAILVVFGRRDEFIDKSLISDYTVDRHNKNTPAALMLIEEISMGRSLKLKCLSESLKIDCRLKGSIETYLKELGFPDNYVRLVSLVIP